MFILNGMEKESAIQLLPLLAGIGSRIMGSRLATAAMSRLSSTGATMGKSKFFRKLKPNVLRANVRRDLRNIPMLAQNPGKFFGRQARKWKASSGLQKTTTGLTVGFAGAEIASGNPIKGIGYAAAPSLAYAHDAIQAAKSLKK